MCKLCTTECWKQCASFIISQVPHIGLYFITPNTTVDLNATTCSYRSGAISEIIEQVWWCSVCEYASGFRLIYEWEMCQGPDYSLTNQNVLHSYVEHNCIYGVWWLMVFLQFGVTAVKHKGLSDCTSQCVLSHFFAHTRCLVDTLLLIFSKLPCRYHIFI